MNVFKQVDIFLSKTVSSFIDNLNETLDKVGCAVVKSKINLEEFLIYSGSVESASFFRYDNPLHELAVLESGLRPTPKIQAVYSTLYGLVEYLRFLEPDTTLSSLDRIQMAYSYLASKNFNYGDENYHLLTDSIDTKKMACDASSLAVYLAGQEVNWPVSLARGPEHLFLRWDDGTERFNIDFGISIDDAWYKSHFNIAKKSVDSGTYLKPLTRKQVSSEFYTMIGSDHLTNHHYKKAIQALDTAISLDPLNQIALCNRAAVNERRSDRCKAIADNRNALSLDPHDIETSIDLGIQLMCVDNNEAAIEALSYALSLDDKNIEALYRRGRAYHHKGYYKEAIADFEMVLTYDPDSIEAHRDLGHIWKYLAIISATLDSRDSFTEAKEHLNKVIELEPDNVDGWNEIFSLYFLTNRHLQSIYYIDKAIVLDPKNAGNYFLRSVSYANLGECIKTSEDLARAIKLDPMYGRPENTSVIQLCLHHKNF